MNPTYGSVGLMWSGNWEQCQAAVESVLQGSTIMQLNNHDAAIIPLEGCDIRHLSKNSENELHRMSTRNKFKRPRDGSSFGSGFHQVCSTSIGTEPIKCKILEPEEKRVDDYECGKVLLELSLG
ncbi:LOB domain-containing protein 40-like [Bidens hawaiensis]|uniref:LOB domain-containing protein 40-like n=1 Tax=Bidens hawaiensis TaxID=980011 RepID=UPI0040494D38